MHAVPSLLECQRRFLAALYSDRAAEPAQAIAGNGLAPEARLRIYRHSSEETHITALRTTYPAVLALVGGAFFDQAALGYRGSHPSRSGNLQVFGAHFADYLESLPTLQTLAYLPDVARFEWLRQETALAADAGLLPSAAFDRALARSGTAPRIALHPSVRLLSSRHAVLTIWRYAMQPSGDRLSLPPHGEDIVSWREGGEVAMAELDAASFACVEALMHGLAFDAARLAACAVDPHFDFDACLASLVENGLVTAVVPADREGTRCSSA